MESESWCTSMYCHTYEKCYCWIQAATLENNTLSLLFPPLLSYSMILVEIATRSDLSSVSMAVVSEDYNLQPPFDLCFLTSGPLWQDHAEGMRMDLMWRPPLPELKAGKADTDCPNKGDYCEVCHMYWWWKCCSKIIRLKTYNVSKHISGCANDIKVLPY